MPINHNHHENNQINILNLSDAIIQYILQLLNVPDVLSVCQVHKRFRIIAKAAIFPTYAHYLASDRNCPVRRALTEPFVWPAVLDSVGAHITHLCIGHNDSTIHLQNSYSAVEIYEMIVKNCPALRSLQMHKFHFEPNYKLTPLRPFCRYGDTLELIDCQDISNVWHRAVDGWPQLRHLTVVQTPDSLLNKSLNADDLLADCTRLRTLRLMNCRFENGRMVLEQIRRNASTLERIAVVSCPQLTGFWPSLLSRTNAPEFSLLHDITVHVPLLVEALDIEALNKLPQLQIVRLYDNNTVRMEKRKTRLTQRRQQIAVQSNSLVFCEALAVIGRLRNRGNIEELELTLGHRVATAQLGARLRPLADTLKRLHLMQPMQDIDVHLRHTMEELPFVEVLTVTDCCRIGDDALAEMLASPRPSRLHSIQLNGTGDRSVLTNLEFEFIWELGEALRYSARRRDEIGIEMRPTVRLVLNVNEIVATDRSKFMMIRPDSSKQAAKKSEGVLKKQKKMATEGPVVSVTPHQKRMLCEYGHLLHVMQQYRQPDYYVSMFEQYYCTAEFCVHVPCSKEMLD